MPKVTKIYASRQPNRPHYIREWAEKRQLTQADLARELDSDKSLVSRWYAGTSPTKDYQVRLAGLFSVEPEDLFRPPGETWLSRKLQPHKELEAFLRDSTDKELEKLEQLIQLTFAKEGTNG